MPSSRRLETPLGGLVLCHGIGDDDMAVLRADADRYSMAWLEPLHELVRDEDVALMVGGHTHCRMVRELDGLTVINAGTLHRDFVPGFIVVDVETRRVEAFDVSADGVLDAEVVCF